MCAANLGTIFVKGDIADIVQLVLNLPMFPPQLQKLVGGGALWGERRHTVSDLVAQDLFLFVQSSPFQSHYLLRTGLIGVVRGGDQVAFFDAISMQVGGMGCVKRRLHGLRLLEYRSW